MSSFVRSSRLEEKINSIYFSKTKLIFAFLKIELFKEKLKEAKNNLLELR